MTKIEKQMISMTVVFLVSIILLVSIIGNQIDKAGGFKAIIIEAGKEVKDISREIAKD